MGDYDIRITSKPNVAFLLSQCTAHLSPPDLHNTFTNALGVLCSALFYFGLGVGDWDLKKELSFIHIWVNTIIQ